MYEYLDESFTKEVKDDKKDHSNMKFGRRFSKAGALVRKPVLLFLMS